MGAELEYFQLFKSPEDGAGDARGGGVLPSERLLGMRRWMGAHFHNWIDYNGVTRMGSHIFG